MDLRRSTGGNTLLLYILGYFPYGVEGMLTSDSDSQSPRYTISYKQSLLFPADPEAGNLLRPVVGLTYADLIRMDFDPNASSRLALAHLSST